MVSKFLHGFTAQSSYAKIEARIDTLLGLSALLDITFGCRGWLRYIN